MNSRKRVAVVTHVQTGGVWTMAQFVQSVAAASADYESDLILVATSRRDAASMRLLAPRTWLRGPRIVLDESLGRSGLRVGAVFSEIEIQRFRPRRVLTDLLNQYDVVQFVCGTPAYAAAARDVRSPVCVFAATTVQQERPAWLRQLRGPRKTWAQAMTALTTRVERAALTRADFVFALSQYTYQQYAPYVPAARLQIAPAGVDVNFFQPASTYCANGPLICVGRLDDPRKNMQLLFESYAQLKATVADLPRLVLVTTAPPSDADWTVAQQSGITAHIDICLNYPRDKIRELYQAASVFVLSSDEEGLGIVLLEAMACGLPVISTASGGPNSIIQPSVNGMLTPVGDKAALAAGLQQLWRDVAWRQQLGQSGRAMVENQYSLEMAGRAFLNVYDRLLAH